MNEEYTVTIPVNKKQISPAVKAEKITTKTEKTITLRLRKGLIACSPTQRATVHGLGLKRREQISTLENTSAVRGMIKKVLHLVDVIAETQA